MHLLIVHTVIHLFISVAYSLDVVDFSWVNDSAVELNRENRLPEYYLNELKAGTCVNAGKIGTLTNVPTVMMHVLSLSIYSDQQLFASFLQSKTQSRKPSASKIRSQCNGHDILMVGTVRTMVFRRSENRQSSGGTTNTEAATKS